MQLITSISVMRKKFIMEEFIGTDDIFALVESGSFYMESDGGRFTVSANEGALFRKNVLYKRKVITPVKMHLFRYDSDRVLFWQDHVLFKDKARLLSTVRLLNILDEDIFKNEFEKRRHLFCDLVMQYETENRIISQRDPIVEQAILRIKRGVQNGVDLKKIGTESGLSYVQFLRRFKAYVGVSPSEYITALRLQKAKDMLGNSTLRVKQIAYSCGFENEYYFSNFFKKHTSLSPSAFRASLT